MLHRLQQQQQQQRQQPGLSRADRLHQQRMQERILLLHFLQQVLQQQSHVVAAKPEIAVQLLHAQRSLLLQVHHDSFQQQQQQQEEEQQKQQHELVTAGDFVAKAQRLAELVTPEEKQHIIASHAASCSRSSGGLQREVYRHPSHCAGVGFHCDSDVPGRCSAVLPLVPYSTYESLRSAMPAAAAAAAAPAAQEPAAAAAAVAAAKAAGEVFERQQQLQGPPEAAELTSGQAAMLIDALLQIIALSVLCGELRKHFKAPSDFLEHLTKRFVGDLCSSLLASASVSLFLRSLLHAVTFKKTERGNKAFIKIRRNEQQPLPWLLHAAPASTSDMSGTAAAAATTGKQSLALQIASYICAHVYE
ncbi:ecdysone-induced protein 74EF-like [Cyclospora cayetanensis]|uniref:Ecdysone-induced protein 74EF-like n=1 Tax=Cyclospora cayetanensis TaxID=88456 RepID=A0A6P6S0V4_9EIME|nr:ecdysone-induced protein 74EF-like [Cyclospora cayetanensis]